MKDAERPIGVFDSGIGGLTVAGGIHDLLPNEHLVYFGDTRHLPYGDKSDKTILDYCDRIAQFLIDQNCKMIVIACNSASSASYAALEQKYGHLVPIINVIDPVVQQVSARPCGSTAILATPATTNKGLYVSKLHALHPEMEIVPIASKSLATIIEEGLFYNRKLIAEIVDHYFGDYPELESVVLACTHFPIIRDMIEEHFDRGINIFDSTDAVALAVKDRLEVMHLLNPSRSKGEHRFYVSDLTDSFQKMARIFFGDNVQLQYYPLWEDPELRVF